MLQEMEDKMAQVNIRLKQAKDHPNFYDDSKIIDTSYKENDEVFIRIRQTISSFHFKRRTKLSPRFIRPFKVAKEWDLLIFAWNSKPI